MAKNTQHGGQTRMTKRFERRYDEGYTTIYNWYIDGKKIIDTQIIEDTLNQQDKRIKELEHELGIKNTGKRRICIKLNDGFGKVTTSVRTKYSPPQLMDKILEMVTND